MKTLLRLLTINFLMSSSYMFSSAGAPAEVDTPFTIEQLKAKGFDSLINQVVISAKTEDELYKNAQSDSRFIFNPSLSFSRGDLVIMPRSDKTYRYGVIMGYLGMTPIGPDMYRIQATKEGLKKEVSAGFIGRKKPPMIGDVGNAAAGKPVPAHEHAKGANEECMIPFSLKELSEKVVYYPYTFMNPYIGIVPPYSPTEPPVSRNTTLISLTHNKTKAYFNTFGYSFSPQHTFRRGERVLYDASGAEEGARYVQGIILGYDLTSKMYRVQFSGSHGIRSKLFKAEELGQYKIHFKGSSYSHNQSPFMQVQLDVLPIPYQASIVMGEAAIPPKMKNEGGTGGRDIPESLDNVEAQKHFNFSASNKFERGELVVIGRSDKCYRYGIVMGYLEKNQYRVQVNKELQAKNEPAQLIGKLELDFDLLDRKPEERLEVQEAAFQEQGVPEVLKIISEMNDEYDPAQNAPIVNIKKAIRDNDLRQLGIALGDKNKHIEAKDAAGYTPLLFAVYFNNPQAVSFLLKNGANPHTKAMIGHEKEKDAQSALDAFSLARTLGEKNNRYDVMIAVLEHYTLEKDAAEKDKKSAADKP